MHGLSEEDLAGRSAMGTLENFGDLSTKKPNSLAVAHANLQIQKWKHQNMGHVSRY